MGRAKTNEEIIAVIAKAVMDDPSAMAIMKRFNEAFAKHKPCDKCASATSKEEMCQVGGTLYMNMLAELDATAPATAPETR